MTSKNHKLSPLYTLLIVLFALGAWAFEIIQQPNFPKTNFAAKYETLKGCTLAQHRNNDGDSFLVKLPDGQTKIFRLFFVDTPESAFRNYSGGENNHQRIAHQAADMGGISTQQAVEIGKKAKAYALSLLQKSPFTIYTRWNSPFHDGRYSAFVEIKTDQKSRYLHELLVEQGLARIYTRGADLPDGTEEATHKKMLHSIQRQAQSRELGAWGL